MLGKERGRETEIIYYMKRGGRAYHCEKSCVVSSVDW